MSTTIVTTAPIAPVGADRDSAWSALDRSFC